MLQQQHNAVPATASGSSSIAIRHTKDDLSFDLKDPAVLANPFATYEALRERDPVYFHSRARRWYITGFSAVSSVLNNHHLYRQFIAGSPGEASTSIANLPLLGLNNMDGEQHAYVRGLFTPYFGKPFVERLKETITAEVYHCLAEIPSSGEVEFVPAFADRFPLRVAARVLGLPLDQEQQLKKWCHTIGMGNNLRPSAVNIVEFFTAAHQLGGYIEEVIYYKRRNPDKDLISHVLASDEPGRYFTPKELGVTFGFLFAAAHESTSKLLSSIIKLFNEFPEQLRILRENAALIPAAVRECARHSAPIQVTLRVANQDTTVAEKRITAGSLVAALIGAANRDPARYSHPDQLDICRPLGDRPDITFGRGIHHCIGFSQAIVELETALEVLLTERPRLFCAKEMTVEMCPNMTLHGPDRLYLRY